MVVQHILCPSVISQLLLLEAVMHIRNHVEDVYTLHLVQIYVRVHDIYACFFIIWRPPTSWILKNGIFQHLKTFRVAILLARKIST